MKKIFCISCLIICLILNGYAQPVKLIEKMVSMPTYPIAPPDKNPIFFRNEAYQGTSKHVYFPKTQIIREEADNDRQGDRGVQIDYYIGLAYEALGNRSKANSSFRNSANINQEATQRENTLNVMNYYQELSHVILGSGDQTKGVFESLISEADRQLQSSTTSEVDAIFGSRESSNDRMSRLYTMRGLGYNGLGDLQKAKEDLEKAVELSQSNLWAQVEKL